MFTRSLRSQVTNSQDALSPKTKTSRFHIVRTKTSAGADTSLISADQSVPCRSALWRSEGDDEVIIRRGSVPDTCKLNTHHGPGVLPWAPGISPHPVLFLYRLHVPMRQILRTSALSLLLSHLAPSLQLLPPNTRRANPHKPIFLRDLLPPGIPADRVGFDRGLFSGGAVVIIRLLRLQIFHHGAQGTWKRGTERFSTDSP